MGCNVLQDIFVDWMERNPGAVSAGGRLVEHCERAGVGVKKVGHDEGGEVAREDSEVDHISLLVVAAAAWEK